MAVPWAALQFDALDRRRLTRLVVRVPRKVGDPVDNVHPGRDPAEDRVFARPLAGWPRSLKGCAPGDGPFDVAVAPADVPNLGAARSDWATKGEPGWLLAQSVRQRYTGRVCLDGVHSAHLYGAVLT